MNYHNFNNNCKKIKIKSEYSTLYEYYNRKVIITYYDSKGWKRALELIYFNDCFSFFHHTIVNNVSLRTIKDPI